MRKATGALCALLLALAPFPLLAQESDAFVLPAGMLRLDAGAELSRFEALFGDGGTRRLAEDLLDPLTSETFAPLRPLERELARFLAAQGASLSANPETFRLGTPDLEALANTRAVPFSLAAGVLPGLEIRASLPLLREEVLLTRSGLPGGTLALNPAPEENADILALFGEEWAALGLSPLLPTDSSALGRELQRLVEASFPGASLALPEDSAAAELLREGGFDAILMGELGLGPVGSHLSEWRVGDLEVGARYRVLSTFGDTPFPTDSARVHYRAAVSATARFPTGSEPDTLRLLSYLPAVGQAGFGAGVDADVFVGERIWGTLSMHYARRSETEVVRRLADPAAPLEAPGLPVAVRWSPADRISLRLAPRFRLTDAISLGLRYSVDRLGDSSFEVASGEDDASVLDASGGLRQSAGVGIRYSTLPAYSSGAGLLPVDVSLAFERTLGAPDRLPEANTVIVQASLFHRAIGGRP